MQNARLDEAQAGIKIARRNINNLRYSDNTIFREESEKELKNLLMKVKEEDEKAGLTLNIQKTMANRWGRKWKLTDLIFLGSKITAHGDCSHELKDACSMEEKL